MPDADSQARLALSESIDMTTPIVTPKELVNFGCALLALIKTEVIRATGVEEEYLSATALGKRIGCSRWTVYEHCEGDPRVRKLKPSGKGWTRYNVADAMRCMQKVAIAPNATRRK